MWPRLQYDLSLVPEGGTELCCPAAGPIAISHKEPVGAAFHLYALKQAGVYVYPVEEQDQGSKEDTATPTKADASTDADDAPPAGSNWKGGKKKKKQGKEGGDLYALLNLQNERWTANEAAIKMAYRKICLEAHPDKALINVTDEEEKERVVERFKKIQLAYETLSDPAKRREYDSTDDFDDSLPSECAPGDFFKVFAPAFRRNARWSVDPAPDVGDANTPYEVVSKMYDFWYRFKSWREFPHPDEEDIEGAESREHRRWIERYNSKLREKGKKDEARRLRDFVEAAYRHDPRIAAKREAERQEKERKKQEKEDAKRKIIEAEERKKAEEEAARKAAEEEEKARVEEGRQIRKMIKIALGQQRQRLRALCQAPEGGERLLDVVKVERLCSAFDTDRLRALNDCIEGADRQAAQEALQQALEEADRQEQNEVSAKEEQKKQVGAALKDMAKKDIAKKMEAMSEWSEEELRMLDKATNKFVQGTPKRWEQVTAYVRTRTLDEVLLMVKQRQGAGAARMKAQEDWKGAQRKPADLRGATLDVRANTFTDVEVNLRGEAAATFQSGATAANGTAGGASPASSSKSDSTAASAPAAVTPDTKATADSKAFASAAAIAAAVAGRAAKGGPKKVASADSGEWSEEQELALVKALKQFGKDHPERWERVSEVVPGKSKTQCLKRFKELREAFKTKKTAGGGEGGEEDE